MKINPTDNGAAYPCLSRNVAITTAVLKGQTLESAGVKIGRTRERVKQIVQQMCLLAGRSGSLSELRAMADQIIPMLPILDSSGYYVRKKYVDEAMTRTKSRKACR